MTDYGLDLAVIGNGRTAALVDPSARIVWWCFPRFDADPIFCRLLAGDEEKGFADVVLDGMVEQHSEYLRNTAVVSTVLTDARGGSVRITDFAPRFPRFGRMFRSLPPGEWPKEALMALGKAMTADPEVDAKNPTLPAASPETDQRIQDDEENAAMPAQPAAVVVCASLAAAKPRVGASS